MSDTGATANQAGPCTGSDLVRLIYRSHSKISRDTIRQQLGDILTKARKNNAATGVTGALMYYDNWFAQALEGPKDAVHEIFSKIRADDRHNAIEVKSDEPVVSRVFARWAMANVGEHGDPDTPLVPTQDGVSEGSAWHPSPEQEAVLAQLRDTSRGYGRSA